ncbi:hypothetical protein SISNIDRAFT_459728 [Sistotremastrum niveocremeum HHB9708]|uniref:Alpha/beta hydrolase fold-3 domain-containing protein n=2 Tax=Sistotremastraceae TaxID=3402574 RepID=A0A164P9J5_9AGAM|nr:hypothetical protein SISNIDRAFT_459728 [Sistotremastrum niveocremeum HHB9708]KZT32726.1 hypothetical protein SISSUDRAFT_1055157 [Sistotremastrum suecicum HHB10207 ss-3]
MSSTYSQYTFGDPEWDEINKFLLARGLPITEDGAVNVEGMRNEMGSVVTTIMKNSLQDPGRRVSVRDHQGAVDGGTIVIRSYTPAGSDQTETFPLMVWYHGGGFVAGELETDDADLKLLAASENISIVSVDYRLAPEHVFPVQINDSLAALKWSIANAPLLRADPNKGVIVAGVSAGGNLAAQVAIHARDDPSFANIITGQLLEMPWLAEASAYPSRFKEQLRSVEDLSSNSPMLSKDFIRKLGDLTKLDYASPRFSPFYVHSIQDLPKTFIQIAGRDPLRDEAILYGQMLKEAGVPVRTEIYPGCPHAFHYVRPSTAAALKFRKDTAEGIRWLLQ